MASCGQKFCLRCGKVIQEITMNIDNFKSIKSLYPTDMTEDMYYKFFEIEGREIDFKESNLCLPCYSLTLQMSLPSDESCMERKSKTAPNISRVLTKGLGERDLECPDLFLEHNYLGMLQQHKDIALNSLERFCSNCGEDIHLRGREEVKVQYLHELLRADDSKKTSQLESDMTDAQIERFAEAQVCNSCAQRFKRYKQRAAHRKKDARKNIMLTGHPADKPNATSTAACADSAADADASAESRPLLAQWAQLADADPHAVPATDFIRVPTCTVTVTRAADGSTISSTCADGSTISTTSPDGSTVSSTCADGSTAPSIHVVTVIGDDGQHVTVSDAPVKSSKMRKGRSHFTKRAAKMVRCSRYEAAYRFLAHKSAVARRGLQTVCCELLSKEMKKFFKVDSVFSQKVTPDNISQFSLEELSLAAKEISPFIVEALQALLPKPVKNNNTPTDMTDYPTVEQAETVINNRLGFTLGILLYTHKPKCFNYIQSCLGARLQQEKTSRNTIGWLHQAGVTRDPHNVQELTQKFMNDALKDDLQEEPAAVGDEILQTQARDPQQTDGDMVIQENHCSTPKLQLPLMMARKNGKQWTIQAENDTKFKPSILPAQCTLCPKTMETRTGFYDHMRNHRRRPFLCHDCWKMFSTQGNLDAHWCSSVDTPGHKGNKSFQCTLCPKTMETRTGFYDHTRNHQRRPFLCHDCWKMFSTQGNLDAHWCSSVDTPGHKGNKGENKRAEKRKRPFETIRKPGGQLLNPKRPVSRSRLHAKRRKKTTSQQSSNLRTEARPPVYKRRKSLKKLPNKAEGSNSADVTCNPETKTGSAGPDVQSFQCTLCPKTMETRTGFYDHMRNHRRRPFLCRDCWKMFSAQGSLDAHWCLSVDTPGHKGNKCPLCPMTFKTRKFFYDHRKAHQQRPFLCRVCWKMSSTQVNLDAHQCSLNRPPQQNEVFQCTHCPKIIETKKAFQRHTFFHKRRPFLCQVCWKMFTTQVTLDTHSRMCLPMDKPQQKNWPFQCTLCPKTIETRKAFLDHKFAHRQRPFLCQVCWKKFITQVNLDAHRCLSEDIPDQKKRVPEDARKKIPVSQGSVKVSDVESDFVMRSADGKLKVINKQARPGSPVPEDDQKKKTVSQGLAWLVKASDLKRNADGTLKKFQCMLCPQTPKSQLSFEAHKEAHRQNPYCCPACGKMFLHQLKLENHACEPFDWTWHDKHVAAKARVNKEMKTSKDPSLLSQDQSGQSEQL